MRGDLVSREMEMKILLYLLEFSKVHIFKFQEINCLVVGSGSFLDL